jgi:hypothetical protein
VVYSSRRYDMSFYDDCRVTGFIQPGENERWRVSNFEVQDHRALSGSLGGFFRTGRGSTPPGTYTRLDRLTPKPDGSGTWSSIVMSDTSDEIRDLGPLFYARPHGRIIVNGLGLGCVVKGLLALDAVEHVDVVEVDEKIIELVGSQYTDPRVAIHHGDAFTFQWPANTTWDFAWHDVWDDLCTDNLSNAENAQPGTYAALKRRYGRRVGWQGAWGEDFLRSRRAS